MITDQVSMRVSCDQGWFDSAAITSGILMASAAGFGYQVELGPFSSQRAAEESCKAAGWLLVEVNALRGDGIIQLCYCPVHCAEAAEFWQWARADA